MADDDENSASVTGVSGAIASTPGTKAATVALKIYRAPTIKPGVNPNLKKASVTPRNTRTYLHENEDLDRTPAQLNKPDNNKTKFRIKHTNMDGTEYLSEREFQRANENKWDDKAWIFDLNKWRVQTFDRLFRHDPDYETKMNRPKWSMVEKSWLEYKVRKHGLKYGDQLNGKDWERISKAHEVRFVGTMIKKGEELLSGKISKSDQQIHRRKPSSIRAQFAKFPEMKAMLQKIIDEFSDGEQEDVSSEGEEEFGHLSDDEEVKDG